MRSRGPVSIFFASFVLFMAVSPGFADAAAAVGLPSSVAIAARQVQPRQAPPEMKEIQAALNIPDRAARLKELERILAAYPQSQYKDRIETAIIQTKIEMTESVAALVTLQRSLLDRMEGPRRLYGYFNAGWDILRHPNLAMFDRGQAAAAVLRYAEEGRALARDPAFLKAVPKGQEDTVAPNTANLRLIETMAYLYQENAAKAAESLKRFHAEGGIPSPLYHNTRGVLLADQGKPREAADAFLAAAAGNFPGAAERAREAYVKARGSAEGFQAELDARLRELPFHPEPFASPAGGSKTVVAELFTGSECPPCVAADLGFDGLLESFQPRDLAVLVYHLHIPRPDPMTNPASQARARYYGVRSTPSTFFDGAAAHGGGGGRDNAAAKFAQYGGEVKTRLAEKPDLKLSIKAALAGEDVAVEFSAGRSVPGADAVLALVEEEVRFKGGNGLVFHKMVVRDVRTLDEAALRAKTARFSIPAAESAALDHLTEFEKTRGFAFSEKKHAVGRSGLRVVFFVQDRESKKILNAAVAEVESPR